MKAVGLLALLAMMPAASAADVGVAPGAPAEAAVGDEIAWHGSGSYSLLLSGVGGTASYSLGGQGGGSIGPGGLLQSSLTIRGPRDPELRVTDGTLRMILAQSASSVTLPGGEQRVERHGMLESGGCAAFVVRPHSDVNLRARWNRTLELGGDATWTRFDADLGRVGDAPAATTNETVGRETLVLQACAPQDADVQYSLRATLVRAPDAAAPAAVPASVLLLALGALLGALAMRRR